MNTKFVIFFAIIGLTAIKSYHAAIISEQQEAQVAQKAQVEREDYIKIKQQTEHIDRATAEAETAEEEDANEAEAREAEMYDKVIALADSMASKSPRQEKFCPKLETAILANENTVTFARDCLLTRVVKTFSNDFQAKNKEQVTQLVQQIDHVIALIKLGGVKLQQCNNVMQMQAAQMSGRRFSATSGQHD